MKGVKHMKKPIVLTVTVHKGGVGKSSIVSSLSCSIADKGYKVLVIDSDSQKNLTKSFGVADNDEKNFYDAIMSRDDLGNHILETEYKNVDIIVGHSGIKELDSKLRDWGYMDREIRKRMQSIIDEGTYDFIIFDTKSSIGPLNTSILHASDYILIPIEASSFSLDGVMDLMEQYDIVKEHDGDVKILGIVLNKVDLRKKSTLKVAKEMVTEMYGEYLLKNVIRTDANIENSQMSYMPLKNYVRETRGRSNALDDFNALADEIIELIK